MTDLYTNGVLLEDNFNSYLLLLKKELDNLKIKVTDAQAVLLLKHLLLVQEKNKDVNLTHILSVKEGIYKHIIDSLLLLPLISPLSLSINNFLDIGTGAGYPGIPLSVVTGWQATLIDSVGKKINALKNIVSDLNLQHVTLRHVRVEELAKEIPHSFDLVVARAVAELAVLIEYAAPLLSKDGVLVVTKGRPSFQEISSADSILDLCGMKTVSRETVLLPHGYGERNIFIYKKIGHEKVELPRKNGIAKMHPLYMKNYLH